MIIHVRAPKNTAFILVTPVYDGEWSDAYVSTATGLDSEVSNDKGAFADLTGELTEIGTSGVYTLDLTAAQMNYDLVTVKMTTTTVGGNIPLFVIHTFVPTEDVTIEGTYTLSETLRILLAVLAGKSSGGGTVTLTFRDVADGKNRVTATVNANGDRTAITLDES